MLISNLFIATAYRKLRNNRTFLFTDILILTRNDKWNSILFSISHILSIYLSAYPSMGVFLTLYLLL